MRIHPLKCFGTRPGEGNTALVIEEHYGSEAERQAFAREQAMPACVFINRSDDLHASWVFDYYYPHTRSPLCLHATLAAASLVAARAPVAVKTAMHGQRLTLSREGEHCFAALTRQETSAAAPHASLLRELLGAPALAWRSAPAVASVGSPKLLVEVEDAAALYGLHPDLAAIAAWGKEHGVNGIYAWCRRADGQLEGRNFNHLDPALEDSATGVAAGALTVLLGEALQLHQGYAIGQACLIRTQLDELHVKVGGLVCA